MAARVIDVLDAHQRQEVTLGGRTDGGEHLGAQPLGDLQRRDAHPPGSPVDQHLLAGFQTRQMLEGVVDGEEGGRDGRCRFQTDALRHAGQRGIRDHQAVREAGGAEADHPLTDREFGVVPGACHHTGELEPQTWAGEAVLDGFIRQQSQGVHHVAEVEAGGLDTYLDVTACHLGEVTRLPLEIAQLARLTEAQTHAAAILPGCLALVCRRLVGCLLGGHRQPCLCRGCHLTQTCREAGAIGIQHDFLLVIRGFDFLYQRVDQG